MNKERASQLTADLLDAFKALPNGLAPVGQLSLLRVVATFPSEPTLQKQSTKESPVAILNTATFKAVTEPIPPQDLIQTLVFSMHSKRASKYPDNVFSPVKPISKKLEVKRKMLQTLAETSLRKDDLIRGDSSATRRGDSSATRRGDTSDIGPPPQSAVDRIPSPVKRAKRKCIRSRRVKS
ncbi:hypothetical protein C0992_005677 [Termitomyces sp. T32_za158]|nr:hypothetical protein C0992_005677 [Termitomyces sp. T32_za158]